MRRGVARFCATVKHLVESAIGQQIVCTVYAVLRSSGGWLYRLQLLRLQWLGELSAEMENASLTADVWNTSSTSDHDHDDHDDHDHDHEGHYHLAHISVFALKVIYNSRSSTSQGHPQSRSSTTQGHSHLKVIYFSRSSTIKVIHNSRSPTS